MRNTNKKGFTIVELVIVVAVIAILAAVLIPTFSSIIRKANESKDNQLIKHLNTAIAADVDGDKTMSGALAAAAEFGFDLSKIDAKVEGNEILWDSVANVFCYLNNGKVEYLGDVAKKGADAQLWIIDTDGDTATHPTYSSYVAGVAAGTTVVAENSIDVTACVNVNVAYNKGGNVAIYTNGGNLSVSNESAEVAHYGEANEVIIGAVANASYHEFGKAGFTQVNKGHYVMEKGGSTNALVVAADVTVDNKGGNVVAQYNAADVNVVAVKFGATSFAGGLGTEAAPYLIENAEHMQNISLNYESETSAYYKVADGVKTIDGSIISMGAINLNGCFDGNGVTFTGVNSSSLFANIKNVDGLCEVGNFTTAADCKFVVGSNGTSVIRSARSNAKIYDIIVHGHIEGTGHVAGFVSYVYGDELTIQNCYSDADLVCTGHAWTGGFIGHAFTAKIYIDNSEFAGNTYAGASVTRYLYVAQNNTGTFYVGDTQVANDVYNPDKCFDISIIKATQTEKWLYI